MSAGAGCAGHIARKGNRYYAVVYEGINPKTGKPRHRWYAGGATRREAEKVLTDLVKRVHNGDYRSPERITLGAYLTERWVPLRKSQVRLSTCESFRRTIDLHVIPHIGQIPMEKLTPEDLDSLYAYLLTEGRRNGDRVGLSPKTVRNIHKALADAVRKRRISRNVAHMADPPKPRQSSSMQVWDAEQLRQFLAEIDDHPLASAFYPPTPGCGEARCSASTGRTLTSTPPDSRSTDPCSTSPTPRPSTT